MPLRCLPGYQRRAQLCRDMSGARGLRISERSDARMFGMPRPPGRACERVNIHSIKARNTRNAETTHSQPPW
jgi:hypothetical protein